MIKFQLTKIYDVSLSTAKLPSHTFKRKECVFSHLSSPLPSSCNVGLMTGAEEGFLNQGVEIVTELPPCPGGYGGGISPGLLWKTEINSLA